MSLVIAYSKPGDIYSAPLQSNTIPLYSWWNPGPGDNFATTDPNWSGNIGDTQSGYTLYRIEGYIFDPNQPQPTGTVPVYSWWHPGREDNFATTDPNWSGNIGDTQSGYTLYRIEGYIFDPNQPQPPGTVPVYSWWNPGPGDNFSTTDPNWSGNIGDTQSGYTLYRVEGYIYPVASSTVPLYSWWNPGPEDNFATTDPNWAGNIGDTQSGYTLYRIEGYVFDPDQQQPSGTVPIYSWWNPGRGDNFASTNPYWSGNIGDTKEGYTLYRIEGYIFDPDQPQPQGTVPVYSWWNPEPGENFATTDLNWSGDIGDKQSGYTLYRLEGYVYTTPPETVSSYSWWNSGRGDNFATTNGYWSGEVGDEREGYTLYRTEGYFFNPNLPQPVSTVPVYSWWHPGRGDNFATTDPNWSGDMGDTQSGYTLYRIEGYIFDPDQPQPPGTVAVYSWWNPDRGDNFATTDPNWSGNIGDTQSGYTLYRIEGYAYPTSGVQFVSPLMPDSLADQFGYNSMRRNNVEAKGERPLLVGHLPRLSPL